MICPRCRCRISEGGIVELGFDAGASFEDAGADNPDNAFFCLDCADAYEEWLKDPDRVDWELRD